MPGPLPVNYPFPETPKALTFFEIQRYCVGLRQWAAQFVIDLDPPGSIPSVSARASNLTIVISWEPAKKAAAYRIHRGTTGDFAMAQFIAEVPASKTKVARYSYQDAQDSSQATRFYWITPINERGMVGPKSGLIQVNNFFVSETGTAVGIDAEATGDNSVAVGIDAIASGDGSVAIGYGAESESDDSIAIGTRASADENSGTSVVLGVSAAAVDSEGAVVIGNTATATTADNSVAVGKGAVTLGPLTTALGYTATASNTEAIAIGAGAEATATDAIALGGSAQSTTANQFTIGSATSYLSETRTVVAANGQMFHSPMVLTELTTIGAAAFTDTVIQIPQNAVVYGVSVRVTVAIPTAVTFDVGVAGATTRYATGLSTAANTTYPGTDDAARAYLAAVAVRITPNAGPAAATGRVRTDIYYYAITPATS